jgi:hypothetical protein
VRFSAEPPIIMNAEVPFGESTADRSKNAALPSTQLGPAAATERTNTETRQPLPPTGVNHRTVVTTRSGRRVIKPARYREK